MRAANTYPDIPLFGINFGKVGFLAMVEQATGDRPSVRSSTGRYLVQNGSTLAASVSRDSSEIDQGWAINDVVIRGGVRMIDVEVYIDGLYVNTYPGDGMIVATPRGSTAYCMAAGGPILTAGVQGFAIVPISCHSPIRTPFIVEESAVIEFLMATKHEASLILDGRPTIDLTENDVVRVVRGATSVPASHAGIDELLRGVPNEVQLQDSPGCRPQPPQAVVATRLIRSPLASDFGSVEPFDAVGRAMGRDSRAVRLESRGPSVEIADTVHLARLAPIKGAT